MVDAEDIIRHVDEIAATARVERIILFGSYAAGNPTEDSDVDLLVVRNYRGRVFDAMHRIRLATNPPYPWDLIVRSPAEIRRRLQMGDVFIRHILETGIVLYESGDQRMGEQGRRRLRYRTGVATIP